MNKPKTPAKFAKYISDSPKCAIVTLDQPLVDWLLEINTHNRNAMPAVVNRYATEIARGEWCVTSQGFGISRDGVLIDGQHRLLALRKCGYPPTRAVLAWGLDENAQIKIDTHAKRSVSNILSLALGCKMNNKQTAGFRILATIDAGKPFDTELCYRGGVADTSNRGGVEGDAGGEYVVRRLTPRECERLQGFPDDWTRIPYRGKPAEECPDGPRYKAMGNSWGTNCAEWILRRILAARPVWHPEPDEPSTTERIP